MTPEQRKLLVRACRALAYTIRKDVVTQPLANVKQAMEREAAMLEEMADKLEQKG